MEGRLHQSSYEGGRVREPCAGCLLRPGESRREPPAAPWSCSSLGCVIGKMFPKQAALRFINMEWERPASQNKSHRPGSPRDGGQGEGQMGAQTLFYFFNCTNFLSVAQGVRNRAESRRHGLLRRGLSGAPRGLCGVGTGRGSRSLAFTCPGSGGQSAVWPGLDDQ